MHIHTASDIRRDTYVYEVRDWLTEYFDLNQQMVSQHDGAWDAWVTHTYRAKGDLLKLIESDVRDEFKARALSIRFAPCFEFLPFTWKGETWGRHFLSADKINLVLLQSNTSTKLFDYALGLLEICMKASELAEEYDENMHYAMETYIVYACEALRILPENDDRAQSIFDLYPLNDPIPFKTQFARSGYNPFNALLLTNRIPEKWKKKADDKMREVVREAYEGVIPRCEWENALHLYRAHTQHGYARYSLGLYASQIEFILDLPHIEERYIFLNRDVGVMLNALKGKKYAHLRYRLAKQVLHYRAHGPRFDAYTEQSYDAAKMMLDQFGRKDESISRYLSVMIANEDARRERSVLERKKWDASENEVLSAMR